MSVEKPNFIVNFHAARRAVDANSEIISYWDDLVGIDDCIIKITAKDSGSAKILYDMLKGMADNILISENTVYADFADVCNSTEY